MTKKMIEASYTELDEDFFEGTPDYIIEEMNSLKSLEHEGGWRNIRITTKYNHGNEFYGFEVKGCRMETDRECKKRLKEEARALAAEEKRKERALKRAKKEADKKEAHDRKEYERLHKKFGGFR